MTEEKQTSVTSEVKEDQEEGPQALPEVESDLKSKLVAKVEKESKPAVQKLNRW